MNADLSYQDLNALSHEIIGAAQRVSNVLGAGFLEKVYENALCWELRKRGLGVSQQQPVEVFYDGRIVGNHVMDLVVGDAVLVEIKAQEFVDKCSRAQCLNYLRATGLRLCILLNFGRSRIQVARLAMKA